MQIAQRNIVVLFNEELNNTFIEVSNKINQKVSSKIVLNTIDMIPHLTVYTTNFPNKNEEKVKAKLQQISQSIQAFPLTLDHFVIDMLGVWLNAKITPELQQVHETIVDALNDLRDGLYDENELKSIGDNKERQQSLYTYGMWAAKDLYIPHITLSRPKDPSKLEEALSLLPKNVLYETMIKEIAFVERGPFGTCKKILEKYSLQ